MNDGLAVCRADHADRISGYQDVAFGREQLLDRPGYGGRNFGGYLFSGHFKEEVVLADDVTDGDQSPIQPRFNRAFAELRHENRGHAVAPGADQGNPLIAVTIDSQFCIVARPTSSWYAIGTCGAPTRTTGASRSKNASS